MVCWRLRWTCPRSFWGPSLSEPPCFHEFSSWRSSRFSQWILEKNPAGEEEITILKHMEHSVPSKKVCLRRIHYTRTWPIGVSSESNQPLRKGNNSILPSHPIPPKRGKQLIVNVRSQVSRLTKDRPNHRTLPPSHSLYYTTKVLFTWIPFTQYILSGFQQKFTRYNKGQNHS